MKATEVRSVENAKAIVEERGLSVEHYAATREWEEREFRKHITDAEMERYFEII